MAYFEEITRFGHEQVVFCHDRTTGLKAVIAIHSTVLGPALGGCRMWPFESEEAAVMDALRLARGMTYKNAAAGLNLGGGKAVIIGDPKSEKTEALFRSFGQFVQSLHGRYITAEDVGTCVQDMEAIKMETDYVSGLSHAYGGSGDPSPFTALGTFEGIRASASYGLGKDSLEGLTVAVQGLGHVGMYLCEYLTKAKAKVIVTDIDPEKIESAEKKFNALGMGTESIFEAEADIFAPCALGGVLNDNTIPKLKAKIVAGPANNQLLDEKKHGKALRDRGILYAPDYIINAGGVINVYYEVNKRYIAEMAKSRVRKIYNTLLEIYTIAEKENITNHEAANALAEKRIETLANIHRKHMF